MAPSACHVPREALVACLLRTDCVLKQGNTPAECLKKPEELPPQCQHLITRFADCKKGMLDMRRRFRGNHLSDEAKARASGIHRPQDEYMGGDQMPDKSADEEGRY